MAGATTKRWSAARIEGPPRRGRARHANSARPSGRAAPNGVNGRPEYVMQACEASLKRLGVEVDRPLLPAPRRSRRCRSRTPSAPWRSWSSRARCAISGCARPGRSASAAPTGAPDRRGAERIFAALPRRGRERPAHDPRTRHRLRRLRAARPRPADRRRSRTASLPRATRAAAHPRFPADNFAQEPRAGRSASRRSPREKRCTPAQLALAWLLAQGPDVVPIPGTAASTAWKKISARCASS